MLALPFAFLLAASADWSHYGADPGGSKFSPHRQINKSNVTRLRPAWTFRTGDLSDGRGASPVRSAFEATPIHIDGVLYFTTPFNRVIALDADTGKQLWAFDPQLDRDRPYNLFTHRGVAFWQSGADRRIIFGTEDGRLFALNAANGQPHWTINLREGVADAHPTKSYGMTSPPAVFENLAICGAWVSDSEPLGPSGAVRAFDIRTGKLVWRFDTLDPASFENGSSPGRGGANVWSIMSVDPQRALVFLPTTSAAYDYYGGDRRGSNLYADSLVALNARTGQRVWHFQTVHHNIWDYDLPAQPMLISSHNQPAVAQLTKQGFVFLFNRLTGAPLFPIEERPVPASKIPGEQAHPTQPYPVKPPPVARQSMSPDELSNVTPESAKFCRDLAANAVFAPMYTPIGPERTILFPGTNGGVNWGGGSYDPVSKTLYVNSMDVGMTFQLIPGREGASLPFRTRGAATNSSRFWDPNLYSCQTPPWGRLTAINMETGEFRWQSTLGEYDELTRRGIPKTGTPNLGGPIVTAGGLLFIAATNDSRFRAFDKDTGRELWQARLPASGFATPMTYIGKKSKKQFVVIAAGGGNKYSTDYSDSLIAFALPD